MSEQEQKRQRVYDLLDVGISQSRIAEIVNMEVRSVHHIQQAKNDGKGIKRAPGSGGHNLKHTPAFLSDLKAKINEDPTISMVRRSRELGVSDGTVRIAVHNDLGLKSFVRVTRRLLTMSTKEKRLKRCQKLLTFLKHHGSTVKIFSDKKIFMVDQVHNHQNF